MSGFPLPVFSYHEAQLVGDFFLQDSTELCMEPPDGDLEEIADSLSKKNWAEFERIYTAMEEAINRFTEFLDGLNPLPSMLRDINKAGLAARLRGLNQPRRVQLYFAVSRYFCSTIDESRASALARAGLIDPKKLPIAKLLEGVDRRLVELERNGIKFRKAKN